MYQMLIAAGLMFWAASSLIPTTITTAGRTAAIAVSCVMFLLAMIVPLAGSMVRFAP